MWYTWYGLGNNNKKREKNSGTNVDGKSDDDYGLKYSKNQIKKINNLKVLDVA